MQEIVETSRIALDTYGHELPLMESRAGDKSGFPKFRKIFGPLFLDGKEDALYPADLPARLGKTALNCWMRVLSIILLRAVHSVTRLNYNVSSLSINPLGRIRHR